MGENCSRTFDNGPITCRQKFAANAKIPRERTAVADKVAENAFAEKRSARVLFCNCAKSICWCSTFYLRPSSQYMYIYICMVIVDEGEEYSGRPGCRGNAITKEENSENGITGETSTCSSVNPASTSRSGLKRPKSVWDWKVSEGKHHMYRRNQRHIRNFALRDILLHFVTVRKQPLSP